MPKLHDPYLTTAKRTLNDEKIKKRLKKLQNTPVKSKGFFSKNITLSDYIYIPENLQNFFIISLFILIPYLFGSFIMFILMTRDLVKETMSFSLDSFMLSWTIGYECIAFILLIVIIKSAFTFTKKEN